MHAWLHDLTHAFRRLLARPGLTATAILTLALGFGINTALFSVVNAVLLHPLPFSEPDRLVYLWETEPRIGVARSIVSPANLVDWREQTRSFEGMAAWRTWFYTIRHNGPPEQVWGVRTSANFFDLLRVRAQFGRTFRPEDDRPGHDRVAILSHGLWQRRFAGDPSAVGRSIIVDDHPFTIVGVLPSDFDLFGGRRAYDLWMPYPMDATGLSRGDPSIIVFARLKPKVTVDQAQADMTAVARRLESQFPATNRGRGVRVVTLHERQAEDLRPALLVLLASVGVVLLIACANVAGLQLAGVAARRSELVIRAALGASRWRLARPLLIESVLLSLAGAAAGMIVVLWGLDLLRFLLTRDGIAEIPRVQWIAIDRTVLAVTMIVSLVTGAAFGLAPYVSIRETGLSDALRRGGRTLAGVTSHRFRDWLVVGQVAMAVTLLVCASLLVRSFVRVTQIDPGFSAANLLTLQVWLSNSRYGSEERIASFYERTLQRLRDVPGVASVSAINFLPLSGWNDMTAVEIDRRAPADAETPVAQYRVIDPNYFATVGIPRLRGRAFDEGDHDETRGAAIINAAMARRYWPKADPIGARIRVMFPPSPTPWRPASHGHWLTIVGIVGDVRESGLSEVVAPQVYLPAAQNPSALMRLTVRASVEPLSLVTAIEREVHAVDPGQAVTDAKLMDAFVSESTFRRQMNMMMLAGFGGLALVLAGVGLFGVLSSLVTDRAREIGVRLALGAEPMAIARVVLDQGFRLTVRGVLLGAAVALLAAQGLRTLLFGVPPLDPVTFAVVPAAVVAAALAAAYLPARRATRIDPITALRADL